MLRSRAGSRPRRGDDKAWLFTIALNCLRDGARRRTVEHRAFERIAAERAASTEDLGGRVDAAERSDQVQRALAALPDPQREALALRFGADLSLPEIARTLGVPLTTAEGRVYHGLRRLRDAMR